MAGNRNRKSTTSVLEDGKSKRMKYGKRWGDIKEDACQMYVQEGRTLKDTMRVIQELYGFKKGIRRWKDKMKEWGYKKNKKACKQQSVVALGTKRRTLEGKETEFSNGRNWIRNDGIDNFKRRRTGEVSPSFPIHPDITYCTPPLTASSASTGSQPNWAIDHHLTDETQTSSTYNLFGDHDGKLAEHRQLFANCQLAISEDQHLLPADLYNEHNFSVGLLCRGDQSSADFSQAKDQEHAHDEPAELAFLEDLSRLTAALADFQKRYGEFADITLQQEYELAKLFKANNHMDEAEHHCRRILADNPRVNVQTFLGMILANTFQLEESAFLLFSAIAGFIIKFDFSSSEASELRFPHFEQIDRLYIELNKKMDQDWTYLTACVCKMMTTIDTALSDGSVDRIFPRLLIQGFSIAHECSVLGSLDSARHMYHLLLKHTSKLDVLIYGNQMAEAQRDYGLLLRQEQRWTSSAKELHLASKSATKSGTHDRKLLALLKTDYVDLFLHSAYELVGEELLGAKIRRILFPNDRQSSLRTRDVSMAAQLSRKAESLLSDTFEQLVILESSAASSVAQSGVPFNHAHGDGDHTSMVSESTDHRIGVTYPSSSECTGIDNSCFMEP